MKTQKLFFICFFCVLTFTLAAQWVTESPYPTSHTLRDVCFVDENTGWITGNEGTIIFTDDGGENWIHQESGTLQVLSCVSFIDENNGWVVGGGGTLLHSVDGGENWMDKSISDTLSWNSVDFKDQNNGWMAGKTSSGYGIIMHTKDAGNNWELQLLEPDDRFNDLCFTSLTSGWAIGQQGIFHTNDGGETWNKQYNYMSWSDYPTISFIDSLNGWANGGGPSIILRTINGGETWYQHSVSSSQIRIIDICFLDSMNGWILCIEGEAGSEFCYPIYTIDGGINWNYCPYNNISRYAYAMSFINPETGWIVGNGGSIIHTSNGEDWNLQSLITNNMKITNICFIDDEKGWALGNSYNSYMECWLLQTNNGGADWVINSNFYYGDWLQKIFKIDENNLWVIGADYTYQTKDGGENWEIHYELFGMTYTNDLFFSDMQHGWAVIWDWNNTGSKIYHTSDEGVTWVEQYLDEGEYLQSVYFTDQNKGWVCGKSGDSGVIINTIDGGTNWTNQLYANDQLFIKIHFSDSDNGQAIGNNGSVFQTDNGGETWSQINEGFDVDFSDVFVVDSNNLWAIGNKGQHPQPVVEGLIYYSGDRGQTWTQQESGTSEELLGIWFNNADNGWIVGEMGTILYTENGGTLDVEEFRVRNSMFKVKCFPNPFTTSTTIHFTLPNASHANLEIHNPTGKKILTLHSGYLQAGEHSFVWSAQGMQEGMYLLRIEMDGVAESRKLLLVE